MTERGAVAIVMTVIVALLAFVMSGTAIVGVVYAAKAQASTASDAAALAAAVATYPAATRTDPSTQAARTARQNGAALARCVCPIDASLSSRIVEVTTVVEVNVPLFGLLHVSANSRAEFDPRSWLGR